MGANPLQQAARRWSADKTYPSARFERKSRGPSRGQVLPETQNTDIVSGDYGQPLETIRPLGDDATRARVGAGALFHAWFPRCEHGRSGRRAGDEQEDAVRAFSEQTRT